MSSLSTASSEEEPLNRIRLKCSSESPITITSTLEDLQIVRKMRRSRFPIYLVASQEDQKHYVMKIYPYEGQKISPYFLREQRISSFSHPNLISIIDTQSLNTMIKNNRKINFSYTLMEYAPYGDFCSLIVENKLVKNDKLIRTYFHQLIEGIEYIHSHGLAHLDLKLDNLLLAEDYTLKITDFDSCQSEFEERIYGAGTIDYRAPEVINRRIYNPKAADIYSAGIILFSLKFHFFPYMEGNPIKGYDMHDILMNRQESFWDILISINRDCVNCDEEFKNLFLSMVNSDPSKRPSTDMIKQNKWYQGPIFSKKELNFIMKHLITPDSDSKESLNNSCRIF
jgi:Protein kinase domain.